MTKTQRRWRDKKLKRIRVIRKIHNSILRGITGMMAVFFLLSLCAMDNANKYVIAIYCISFTWLSIVIYANNLDHGKKVKNK
jgi:hypothetical protein